MSEELEVLKTVTQRLKEAGIAYMITGSIATNFYAMPRMTRDIDIIVEIESNRINQLFTAFRNDFYIDREMMTQAIQEKGMFNIIHNESMIKVDFIVRKDSLYRELEFRRRRRIEIEGATMWIVSPEDLILSKLAWAKDSLSELQLGDVKNLLGMLKDIDLPYIEQWIQPLDLNEIYDSVKP